MDLFLLKFRSLLRLPPKRDELPLVSKYFIKFFNAMNDPKTYINIYIIFCGCCLCMVELKSASGLNVESAIECDQRENMYNLCLCGNLFH